ncbi:MAG: hypothetical protein H0X39_05465 [Actinobacteria bacterium]|nr:hypothetical protein [Actinomycetota bacterium]
MTSITIRDLEIERDLGDVLALMREMSPTYVINEAALLHRLQTVPARSHPRAFVAELDGRVVGRSQSRFDNFFSDGTETAFISVEVTAAHTAGRGSARGCTSTRSSIRTSSARLAC